MNIFVDDGGVMSDPRDRPAQWQALVSEFFSARLGGEAAAWAEANRLEIQGLFARFPAVMGRPTEDDWQTQWQAYQVDWVRLMARRAGIAVSDSDAACLALADEASIYITRRVRVAYPGAADALRSLHATGHRLFTASGTVSYSLDGTLRGMGVRHLFQRIYGPDLINVGKGHSRFYEAVFAHAGVDPTSAAVVDDSSLHLLRAAALGAKTVLVSKDKTPVDGIDLVISSLGELPQVVQKLR